MYKFDYHTHTDYSLDSSQPMEDLIIAAINKNLDELAITDHFDFYANNTVSDGQYDYDLYIQKIQNYKKKYADKIKITWGVEIGVCTPVYNNITEFINKYDFEFIIMSSHSTNGQELWDGEFFLNRTKEDSYNLYFKEVLDNVKIFSNFSVYGHLDYVRRYWHSHDNSLDYYDYKDIIDKILITLIEKGKGLEVNTSGFRYGLDQIHPQLNILKQYKKLGGEILTIGSDAHKKQDLCGDFSKSIEIIKSAGFNYLTRFEDKKHVLEKI